MPVDRGAIDAQLREIGEGDRWWEQREFRDLPHILHAEERIRGLANGKLLGARRPRLLPRATWLIAATDQRLICLKQERFARKQVEIVPGEIRRLRASSRLRSYQIVIDTAQRRYRIRIRKEDALRFNAALGSLLPGALLQGMDADAASRLPVIGTVAGMPIVGGLLARVTGPAGPEMATREQMERVEAAVERLQGDVERLQHQVAFLEDLLQRRAEGALLEH